jgi:vitamin B12/bleomycin/antimicrobial peptide transport system ATP-binding/permease protein
MKVTPGRIRVNKRIRRICGALICRAPDTDLVRVLNEVGIGALRNLLDDVTWDKRLSEDEKQRLSIARALLFKPDLLLLNEATAALDEPSEIELYQLLRTRLPATTIVATSHRDISPVFDRSIRIERPS